MRFRGLCLAALLALSLSSPLVAGQGAPTMAITIVDLPATATVNAGQTHSAAFQVNVQASGFQCTSAGRFTIDVALTNANAAPTGVTPTVDPTNMSFEVPAGVYGTPVPVPGAPVGQPYNQSQQATLRIAATLGASGTYTASLSASFAGGKAGEGCLGDFQGTSATASHQLTIVGQGTGNETQPPPTTGDNQTGNMTPPLPPPKGLPGFEPLLLLAGGALALAARRRRD